ncbi:MAG: hypothetical protein KDC99_15440 [Cyclobacteriaceae bacterium]|nr:hypothetical protein [Cyclobacteriaceae bacterium]
MAQATPDEIELHKLIRLGDDLAFAKLCDTYLEPTIKKVRNFNWQIYLSDSSLISEVVIDSFYGYFYNPEKFNPEKQTLEKFLVMDAEGDLKNAWSKRAKHQQKFKSIDNEVEFNEQYWNSKKEGNVSVDTPTQIMIDNEAEKILNAELEKHFDSDKDVEMANLILAKERGTDAYACVLEITHLSFEEQQQEVKRNKDRIKKVLDRKMKGKQF